MNTQDQLLKAIIAAPDEDTPRLAYADWLQEHADSLPNPKAARAHAELICAQIEMAQKTAYLQGDDSKERAEYYELKKKSEELIPIVQDIYLDKEGARILKITAWERGFPKQLALTDKAYNHPSLDFIKYFKAITSLSPVDTLKGGWLSPEFITAIEQQQAWGNICRINGIDVEGVPLVLQSSCAPQLQELSITEAGPFIASTDNYGQYVRNTALTDTLMQIANCAQLKRLSRIELETSGPLGTSYSRQQATAIEAVLNSPHLKALNEFEVDLGDCSPRLNNVITAWHATRQQGRR